MIPHALTASEQGNSSVEFAIIAPIFLACLLFVMEGALYSWTKSGLRHGAVAAARCAAVNSTLCGTTSQVQSYAVQNSYGLRPPASAFTVANASCGKQVSVTYQYQSFFKLMTRFDGTISQSACYLN